MTSNFVTVYNVNCKGIGIVLVSLYNPKHELYTRFLKNLNQSYYKILYNKIFKLKSVYVYTGNETIKNMYCYSKCQLKAIELFFTFKYNDKKSSL